MNMTSIGDLAQSLLLRTRSTQLKNSIATLTGELSSGQTSDVTGRLGGDLSYLTDIDRNLLRLEGFAVATTEASLFAGAMQSNLERLQNTTSTLVAALLPIGPSGLDTVRHHAGLEARQSLDVAMASLNAGIGGRSLFAGAATDQNALGTADTLLIELKTVVSGLTTASDIVQAVGDWFSDPAGFDAIIYAGSAQSLEPIQIGSGEYASLSLRANDSDLLGVLRGMALAALATDPVLGLDPANQVEVMRVAGEGLLTSQDKLTGLRADVGFAEARIEDVATRNASANTGLEYAKRELLAADPYETATRLQAVQFQLESLYSVTVRSSRLSLLSFLK